MSDSSLRPARGREDASPRTRDPSPAALQPWLSQRKRAALADWEPGLNPWKVAVSVHITLDSGHPA
jgi:hypothetical protein